MVMLNVSVDICAPIVKDVLMNISNSCVISVFCCFTLTIPLSTIVPAAMVSTHRGDE